MIFLWRRRTILIALVCLQLGCGLAERLEPYGVLGVHRRASSQEIRKAYKTKIKQWHPDKTNDQEALARFVEINAAYELLSDPDRRRSYDNHGITEDSPNFRKKPDYSKYQRYDTPFDDFFAEEVFGGGNKHRRSSGDDPGVSVGDSLAAGGSSPPNTFHKQSITSKAYYNSILPNSHKRPYLILFYSDWCYTCLRIEPIWAKLTSELEPVGFGIAAVHTEHEKELTRKVGAKELPHIILLLDGRVIHYKGSQISSPKILDFIRRKFPYKLVETINDLNVDTFLDGWTDNRVRVLIFGSSSNIKLRYLTTAYKFRSRAQVGYVQVDAESTSELVAKYNVALDANSLLIFQENTRLPVVQVSMPDLPLATLLEVVESHQFLQLPRLSSQEIFDHLCPPESSKTRKRLCVILISAQEALEPIDEEHKREALRNFVAEHKFNPERVRFTYIYRDRQRSFVQALVSPEESDLNLVIVWRTDEDNLKFEWLSRPWTEYSANDNETNQALRLVLRRLLSANEVLEHEAAISHLLDEHTISIFVKIATKVFEFVEAIHESITLDEILPSLSLVVTVVFILVGGYVMSYLVKMEEESVRKQLGAKGLKVDRKSGKVVPELKVHELRAETYNGMVRLLKPGCRTIVLIVDRESKEKLVPKFYKLAWPYRRNKTLMFGFLYIEKGLPWYKKILNLTLPEPRDININPKNCIGTVLSLNGHRRYFCMYHAKHPEGSRKKIYTANNGAVAGAFMGFDSEMEDSGSECDVEGQRANLAANLRVTAAKPSFVDPTDHLPIFEDQLLDGLQLWLDRLFEGSTYRYHINYWPEFPISPANFHTRQVQG